ncbi:MAG: hypothetical protein CV087_07855 [Candidatus Brocadia sp. WS118]|nr:MAG: hypothetical protein CV087_07855 [Candidatus Brocadia sp. WS118]
MKLVLVKTGNGEKKFLQIKIINVLSIGNVSFEKCSPGSFFRCIWFLPIQDFGHIVLNSWIHFSFRFFFKPFRNPEEYESFLL